MTEPPPDPQPPVTAPVPEVPAPSASPPVGAQPYPTYPPPGYAAYPPPGPTPYPPPGYAPYPQQPYAPYPQQAYAQPVQGERPDGIRHVVRLLIANLALSSLLTVYVVLTRHSLVTFQLDHRHITDPAERNTLRSAYEAGIWGRVLGNLVTSIVYTFIVRALLVGKRWAYRRVVLLSILGIVGLQTLWATPYPVPFRVEQMLQTVVLALLLYFVTRPGIKEYCTLPRGRRAAR